VLEEQVLVTVIAGVTSQLGLMSTWVKHIFTQPSINQERKIFLKSERSSWEKGLARVLENSCFFKTFWFWIYSLHLQKTQDPTCKLKFCFDVQIFLNHRINRHELTSNWLHPYVSFSAFIYLEAGKEGRWI
jgi:hypothetical protein